jgi:alkylation response protein AidB-like acyl-CoA dehydrogenase
MWRLTDEQRELRDRIRQFVLTSVRPKMLEVDEICDYPFDVHRALAREGLIGLAVPERTVAAAPTASASGHTSRSLRRSPRPCR